MSDTKMHYCWKCGGNHSTGVCGKSATNPEPLRAALYVYVATSWRNGYQPNVVDRLREDGHDVYDFRGEEGFSWREVDENWANWTPAEYLRGLEHSCAKRGFKRDMDALEKCDACVYVTPCGPSASMEMGHARGAGKLVIAYVPALREPDLMIKMAHLVTDNLDGVRERLIEFSLARAALASEAQRSGAQDATVELGKPIPATVNGEPGRVAFFAKEAAEAYGFKVAAAAGQEREQQDAGQILDEALRES